MIKKKKKKKGLDEGWDEVMILIIFPKHPL